MITATPIKQEFASDGELKTLMHQIYPYPCMSYNYANEPLSAVNHASTLAFIEADVQPDPQKYWVSEVADNVDGTRTAFVACSPEFCQEKIYVQDNSTKKVFEVDWDARMPWRPIQWITWVNNDTLVFLQSANPDHAMVLAVDFEKREVLFQAVVFPDYACQTVTPTLDELP